MKYTLFNYVFIFLIVTPVLADSPESTLQQNAIKVNPTFFSQNDNFFLLGQIENNNETFIIAYNQHLWGNNRMTGRILIFNSHYELIGMYGTINEIPELVNKVLVFPVLEELGNTIDFSLGIPSEVRVDGEIYKYESIQKY